MRIIIYINLENNDKRLQYVNLIFVESYVNFRCNLDVSKNIHEKII